MLNKPATPATPFNDLMMQRWSPRAFEADKPVSREQILSMLEAARWAPSCFGNEPWHFIIWDKNQDATTWQQAFDCLAEGNRAWVNTPVLIAVCAHPRFRHNDKPNRWAQYDTGAAAISLCLQAVALGLAAHQMGGFDADKLRSTFGIPEDITLMSMIAVGYQAPAERLHDELRERETAPRRRQPLESQFYMGAWGNGIHV